MRFRPYRSEWVLLVVMAVCAVLIFLLTGCGENTRGAVEAGAWGFFSGAAEGAAGGPWGMAITGGVGLLVGLGKWLHTSIGAKRERGELVHQREQVLADVVRGVGDFLDRSVDPAEFAGLTPAQVADLMKRRLRESLASAYTDFTRGEVRRVKHGGSGG